MWKKPTDDEMLVFHQVAEELKKKYIDAKNAMTEAFTQAMNSPAQPQPVPAAQPQPQYQPQVQQAPVQPVVQQTVQTQYQPQPQSGYQNPQQVNSTPTWNSNMTSYGSDEIPF